MDLSTLGTLVTIIYLLGIFAFQWVTDWYFGVTESKLLDEIYLCYYYLSGKAEKDDP
jgi:hypothetical protein